MIKNKKFCRTAHAQLPILKEKWVAFWLVAFPPPKKSLMSKEGNGGFKRTANASLSFKKLHYWFKDLQSTKEKMWLHTTYKQKYGEKLKKLK